MEDLKIKTKVVHSQTKPLWNIIGTKLGGKYKIAIVPYVLCDDRELNSKIRKEAFKIAEYINHCFNNSDKIINK